ncbi:MAG: ATP-dependent nuclease [Thermoguttaceae bacterium]
MLTRLTIKNFKGLHDCTIDLEGTVVLVGPNNSGKTTALQALALWESGLRKWLSEKSQKSPKKRSGVVVNRKDLLAIPTSNTRFLWKNQQVRRSEKTEDKMSTRNICISVTVEGRYKGKTWVCGLEFDYANPETLYCRPTEQTRQEFEQHLAEEIFRAYIQNMRVAFLPPMSGLAATERKLEEGSINVLIGEGQTAQVLRNLCYALYCAEQTHESWGKVVKEIDSLFGIQLQEPEYDPSRGEIFVYYFHQNYSRKDDKLELSSAGRGLQQVLLIITFLYLHPNAIVLLDEPDAHLEILRQKGIFERLKNVVGQQQGQIVIATHSEVILNEASERDRVVAFLGKPHLLNDKSQLRKSLVEYGWENYYLAQQKGWVLYLEGRTDLDIFRAFAHILEHPAEHDLISERVFLHCTGDNLPNSAKKHFYAIREATDTLRGYAVFDRIDQSKIPTDDNLHNALRIKSLEKREIENYFTSEDVLLNWASDQVKSEFPNDIKEDRAKYKIIMKECIDEYSKLLIEYQKKADSLWSSDLKASEEVLVPLLRQFFEKIGRPAQVQKSRFWELISYMNPKNVDREIQTILDEIHEIANSVGDRP